MIRFSLRCAQDHGFDSWFQSDAAYQGLRAAGMITCPICGNGSVDKSLMAPALGAKGRSTIAEAEPQPTAKPDLSAPQSDVEAAFAEMRRNVEANSDYVGVNFVAEARRMHEGAAPERSIWGEARPQDVKGLLEDGVRVAPLPFMPSRKTN
jgi:hypothetical protein